MDSQVKEIIGRNWLKNELVKAGYEVATPERDKGIDLIAYSDKRTKLFRAIPIQIKALTSPHFSIEEKYKKFPEMRIIFIWYIDDPKKTTAFCFKYSDIKKIADKLGWTKTASWSAGHSKNKGRYHNNHPKAEIIEMIQKFKLNVKTLFD